MRRRRARRYRAAIRELAARPNGAGRLYHRGRSLARTATKESFVLALPKRAPTSSNWVFRSAIPWPTARRFSAPANARCARHHAGRRARARALGCGSTAEVPLVLFSYYNPVLQMGLEEICAMRLRIAGIDGVLATDLTPGRIRRISPDHARARLDTIFLARPLPPTNGLQLIAACSSGFLYLISRTGVTGTKESLPEELPALVRRVRQFTSLPIAVGFGISQPAHVASLAGLRTRPWWVPR